MKIVSVGIERKVIILCCLIVSLVLLIGSTSSERQSFLDEVKSVIVSAETVPQAAQAVTSVGGEITHQLGIIDAVAARVTEEQYLLLQQDSSIDSVFVDVPIKTTNASMTQTLIDDFESVSFDNNSGTQNWRTDWIESDSDPNDYGETEANHGDVFVDSDGFARIKDDDRSFERGANLAGSNNATLSFVYQRNSFDSNNDYVKLEISADDGNSWVELDRFSGPADDNEYQSVSYDISAFSTDSTRIRFATSSSLGNWDKLYLDDIEIVYEVSEVSPTHTIRDDFSESSFRNSDGSDAWASDWIEEDDYGWAYFGNIFVWFGGMILKDNDQIIQRSADLSDASGASLTVEFKRSSMENEDDYVALLVSADNGTTWTELDRYAGPANDYQTQTFTYDITSYLASNTLIRFQTSPNLSGWDSLYVDSLEIAYQVEASSDDGASGAGSRPTQLINADDAHDVDITGADITIAVIDTGFWSHDGLTKDRSDTNRLLAYYDAIQDQEINDLNAIPTDPNGHGAGITSVILNSESDTDGNYLGVAPDANLVSVKAFDANAAGTYADVIRAVDWVVANKDVHDIRILNLSFVAQPQTFYWDDPLNRAVMQAWEAGIFVVAAAGNEGPNPMTIGVPGNVPYIMTVGAISDNFTPDDPTDDLLVPFSSAGPTFEGFIKPDVIAPGAHLLALVPSTSTIATAYPNSYEGEYFKIAGTSPASGIVSGVAALLLQDDPSLTPDDLKCRLLASSTPRIDENDELVYTVFQQGTGLINVPNALASTNTGCANAGLDISLDLADIAHYQGPADQTTSGDYYLTSHTGYEWDGSYQADGSWGLWSGGALWSGSELWSGGALWSGSQLWSGSIQWDENDTVELSHILWISWLPEE